MSGARQGQKRATFLIKYDETLRNTEDAGETGAPPGSLASLKSLGFCYSYWMNPGARIPSGSYFFLAATTRGHSSP